MNTLLVVKPGACLVRSMAKEIMSVFLRDVSRGWRGDTGISYLISVHGVDFSSILIDTEMMETVSLK